MGIRFACHVCGKRLNIKRDLAGKRGVCPSCSNRFRIPWEDSEKSIPLESAVTVGAAASEDRSTVSAGTQLAASGSAVATLPRSSTPDMIEQALADTPNPRVTDFPSSILDEDPAATWYVRPPSGGQYGPASSEILREWIAQGRVASTALLWRDGWPQWREACETLPELAQRLPNGSVGSRTSSTKSSSHRTSTSASSPQLAGQSTVGSERRGRSAKRVMLIGVLSAVALALLGLLVILVNR